MNESKLYSKVLEQLLADSRRKQYKAEVQELLDEQTGLQAICEAADADYLQIRSILEVRI